jgi:VWFA-related protein
MLRAFFLAGLCGVACFVSSGAAALQTPDPQTATFHAGTRLVEIEVVVRNKNGPIAGLTKDDFTVLDQGKPQRIDVFHAGPANARSPAAPLPAGAVSNRVDRVGEPLPDATVVLIDQLYASVGSIALKAYETKGALEFFRGLGQRDRVAIYTLGRNLRVLQEFTDDHGKLLEALMRKDPGRDLLPPPDLPEGTPAPDPGASGNPPADAIFRGNGGAALRGRPQSD